MKKYKKIQNKNNQRKKQLRTENKEAYQNIILYLRGANINIYQQELIRQDLLDLVLDGQLRDESIEDILGEDLRSVADEIIITVAGVVGKKNKPVNERALDCLIHLNGNNMKKVLTSKRIMSCKDKKDFKSINRTIKSKSLRMCLDEAVFAMED